MNSKLRKEFGSDIEKARQSPRILDLRNLLKSRTPKWERKILVQKDREEYQKISSDNSHHAIIRQAKKSWHFFKWFTKLLVPDFLIGHPNLVDNLKTLRKNPQFKPLRTVIIAWIIFIFTVSTFGIYSFKFASWVFAISSSFVDNSSGTFGAGTYSNTQWNSGSSWLDLSAAGKTALAGYYISGIKDTGAVSTSWTTLSWVPSQPYGKELPNNAVVESGYPTGNADMTGNVLLMHLNETGSNAQEGGTVIDSSGQGNNGTVYGNGNLSTSTAIYNTAFNFNGSSDSVSIPDSSSLDITSKITLEAWVKPSSFPQSDEAGILDKGDYGASSNYRLSLFSADIGGGSGGQVVFVFKDSDGTWRNQPSNSSLTLNAWNHVAVTYDYVTGEVKFYINGSLDSTKSLPYTAIVNNEKLYIGNENGHRYFNGVLDEVAVYNRILSSTEIINNYKRGAERLRFQVRNCASADCSDGTFMGPTSPSDYYSELNNTSHTSTPSISLSGLGSNRYLQYKAFFDTLTNTLSADTNNITIGYISNNSPATPTNSQPANASTTVILLPTLTASAYSDPESDSQTNAMWQIDDNSNFSSPEWIRVAGIAESSTTVNSSNGTFANDLAGKTALAHNTAYYWRVAYKDAGSNVWSASSTATSFTTNIISVPTNSIPASSATVVNLTPILSASAFSSQQSGDTQGGARWIVSANSDLSSPAYDSGIVPGVGTTKAVPAGKLANLTTYYWGVSYEDQNGNWSATSSLTSFDVNVVSASIVVKPIFGASTVNQGDNVNMDVQVLDYSTGAPINNASTTINIYNPNGTELITGATMNYMAGSNGVYRYVYAVPAINGDFLYEVTTTYAGKLGYGTANFDVGTIKSSISAINTNVNTANTNIANASSSLSSQIQINTAKLNSLTSNLDVVIGALIVTQATVNDLSASSTVFVTSLTNSVNDFYKNAVLTFTSGNLNGQVRRISAYNGSTKTITLDPALTSVPANGDAFTITKQNVRAEEIANNIASTTTDTNTKVTDIQTKVTDIQTKTNSIYSLLQTVDTNLSATQVKVNDIRISQQKIYNLKLSDVGEMSASTTYRVKLIATNFEGSPADVSGTPTVVIYDSTRATVLATTSMAKISTGVYEYDYFVPSLATTGLWETVVNANTGGASDNTLNDYWQVVGSPAQVIINSMSDLTVPSITANVGIKNEGSANFEYQYEYCVVSSQGEQCGDNNNVDSGSGAKLINVGDTFNQNLALTVPNPGTYWFKILVHYGTETSGASQQFTAVTASRRTTIANIGSGVASGTAEVTSVDTTASELASLRKEIQTQSAQLAKTLSLIGNVDPQSPGFKSLLAVNTDNTSNLKDIQNKINDLKAVSSAASQSSGASAPIVETYMKFNSVEIDFLVTNPLSTAQTVQFKAFLPEEVRPENILDSSGLKVLYDTDAKTYYVSGDISLGPKQSVTKKVEMKDIWVFDENGLNLIASQASDLAKTLSGTQFESQGIILKGDIASTVNIIISKQKASYSSPQDHIVAYRENVDSVNKINSELDQLKNLSAQAYSSKGIVGSIGGIQTFATWGIILAIVFGFGLLSAVIFAMWRHQTMLAAATMGMSRRELEARLGGTRKRRMKRIKA